MTQPRLSRVSIAAIVVAVAVLLAAGFFVYQRLAPAAVPSVGECITITGEDELDHEVVDCDDGSTYSYLVAEVHDGSADCVEGISYELQSTRGDTTTTDKTACLVPQFTEGACYTIVDDSLSLYAVTTDCAAADFVVDSVVNSSNGSCVSPAEPWNLTSPARTYCIRLVT